jgi:hypothetical protein
MLRALVLPHRKNVREQALHVIEAAAEVLPADDSLLRSARRRHSEKWSARAQAEAPEAAEPFADETPEMSITESAGETSEPPAAKEAAAFPTAFPETSQDRDGDASAESTPAAEPPISPGEAAGGESEFERPWTK